MVGAKRAVLITAVVCCTTIVSHSFGRSVYGLLLPAIEDDLGITHAQAGIPSSGIFVMYVIGVLWVVFTSPWVEPVTIMRASLAISAGALALAATADSLPALTVGVSLAGGAGAGIWMTAPVLATEYVSEARRGVVLGGLTASMGVSNVALGFGTAAWRRSAGDDLLWRPVWWLTVAVTCALLAAMVFVARFSPTDRLATSGGPNLAVLRSLPHWRQMTFAYACFGGLAAGFSAFIVAAIEEHGGMSRSTAPQIFSAVGVASMIAAPTAGALSDRIGRVRVLRLALVTLLVANLLVALGGIAVAIGAVAYGAAAATFPALVAAYVRDSLGNRAFSQALALMTILFSLLSALLPAIVGVVADATGAFTYPYLVLALLPITSLVLLIGVPGGAKSADHPQPAPAQPEPATAS